MVNQERIYQMGIVTINDDNISVNGYIIPTGSSIVSGNTEHYDIDAKGVDSINVQWNESNEEIEVVTVIFTNGSTWVFGEPDKF
jgi:hypothetical protein